MTRRHLVGLLALGSALAALSACAPIGPADLGNPVSRTLGWFGFVNGDDIRRQCSPGSPDTVRLVYNGRYDSQVRVYEVTGRGDSATLHGWVREGTGLLTMQLGDSLSAAGGEEWRTGLRATTAEALWQAIADSGAYQPAPRQTLLSDAVWWLAVGCRNGAVVFHSWQAGTPGFAALRFQEVIAPLDPTNIPYAHERRRQVVVERPRERDLRAFRLEVGPGGLMVR